MTRERVLEDVLRQDAAHIEIDPGALGAILSAPKPSDSIRNRQPDSAQTAPSGGGSAVSGAGRSFFRRMLRFIGITTVTVVVAAVLAVGGYAAAVPCPALDDALTDLNNEIRVKTTQDPGVDVACGEPLPTLADIRAGLTTDDARDRFDANLADIATAHSCLSAAATPRNIEALLDELSGGGCDAP